MPEAPARLMKGVAAPSGAAAAAARSGTRAKRSGERRDAILAAALDEFAARGFAATRLEDVAKRADVAKGTIYLHFADKETLFQELIRWSSARWSARLSGPRTRTFRSGK